MISDEVLGVALDQQILSPHQVERLRELARESVASGAEPSDDEKLRFITGFGDIFVTMGLALFLGSLGYFAQKSFGRVPAWAAIAAAAWALAEFFTRVRRMALPSIVLLVVFAVATFLGFAIVLGTSADQWRTPAPGGLVAQLGLYPVQPLALSGAALATVAAVALHYRRFRVPITLAAGASSVVAAIIGLGFAFQPDWTAAYLNSLLLLCGFAVFALAMRFDMSDPLRRTRRTDIAFWLHLLAAPLVVHPLISGFIGARGALEPSTATAVMVIVLAFGLVAVAIDRRALLVSGLAYAAVAFGTLIRRSGLTDATIPWTVFTLGAFVLLLSAGWRPLRALILRAIPRRLAGRLPQPSPQSVS